MSELFSWPTVIAGMGPPSVTATRTPGCGPGAGRFRLHVGTETTLALRAARRTRGTPGPVPWSAGQLSVTGTRARPTRRPGHGARVRTGANDLRRTRPWRPGPQALP